MYVSYKFSIESSMRGGAKGYFSYWISPNLFFWGGWGDGGDGSQASSLYCTRYKYTPSVQKFVNPRAEEEQPKRMVSGHFIP